MFYLNFCFNKHVCCTSVLPLTPCVEKHGLHSNLVTINPAAALNMDAAGEEDDVLVLEMDVYWCVKLQENAEV